MISEREIAFWRAQAPWADDEMVEQDYLLSQAVALIFQDKFLSAHVAMRGGTVLHKAHLAPAGRYSEDIDLVRVTEVKPSFIKRAVTRVLKPLLGEPYESVTARVRLSVRNFFSKSEILRNTYIYAPTSLNHAHSKLKVEVNVSEAKSFLPLTRVPFTYPQADGTIQTLLVTSYDLNEMLGTKLRAFLQREHGRDLYDFHYAWAAAQRGAAPVDPTIVGAAFRFYMAQENTTYSAVEVERELEIRMRSRKFLADMERQLPVGVLYEPRDGERTFREVFLSHVDM